MFLQLNFLYEAIIVHKVGLSNNYTFQLRSGQTYCTDNECVDLPSQTPSSVPENFTWMMFMMIGAVILYVMRPNSLRRRNNELQKPTTNNGGVS